MKLKLFSNRFLMIAGLMLATCVYAQAQPKAVPTKKAEPTTPVNPVPPVTPVTPVKPVKPTDPVPPTSPTKTDEESNEAPENVLLPNPAIPTGNGEVNPLQPQKIGSTNKPSGIRRPANNPNRAQRRTARRPNTTKASQNPTDLQQVSETIDEAPVESDVAPDPMFPAEPLKTKARPNKRPAVRNKIGTGDNTVPQQPQAFPTRTSRVNRGNVIKNADVVPNNGELPMKQDVIEEKAVEEEGTPAPVRKQGVLKTPAKTPATATPTRGARVNSKVGAPKNGMPLEVKETKEVEETPVEAKE